eukprot:COSAG03_NODE_27787_length_251_cov_0.677632_1_plen_81_part_10
MSSVAQPLPPYQFALVELQPAQRMAVQTTMSAVARPPSYHPLGVAVCDSGKIRSAALTAELQLVVLIAHSTSCPCRGTHSK